MAYKLGRSSSVKKSTHTVSAVKMTTLIINTVLGFIGDLEEDVGKSTSTLNIHSPSTAQTSPTMKQTNMIVSET